MRRTKANRALTFVMAATLLIGSIHGVGAKEQSKEYDAPELTLMQGASDYDLTEGITYDSEKYTLSVTDTGNFDINVAGDYEISYALTGKEEPVEETESTEGTENVESTETVESTENIESTETVQTTEVSEPDKNQADTGEENKPDAADTSDNADDTTSASEEGTDASGQNSEDKTATDAQTDAANNASSDVTIEDAETPKADASNIEGTGYKQKTINFKRIVHVVAAEDADIEDEISTFSDDGIAVQAANSDKIKLGNAVWTDDTHTVFEFTHAKITIKSKIIVLTLPSNVSLKQKDIKYNDGKLYEAYFNPDVMTEKYNFIIFDNEKSAEELTHLLRGLKFYCDGSVQTEKLKIAFDGNETDLNNLQLNDMKIWGMYLQDKYPVFTVTINKNGLSWGEAFKEAQQYKFLGMQGYLLAGVDVGNPRFLSEYLKLTDGNYWVGASALVKDGEKVNGNFSLDDIKKSTAPDNYKVNTGQFFDNDGPRVGRSITYTRDEYRLLDDTGTCMLVKVTADEARAYTVPENYNGERSEVGKPTGYVVAFGNYDYYTNKTVRDPGGRDEDQFSIVTINLSDVRDAEVKIIDTNQNEVKYGPLADALDEAEAYETVEIIKDSVTPATDAILKKNVMLKSNGRNFVYTGDADASKIDVDADGSVTMTDGHIRVSDNVSMKVKSPADGNTYQITTPAGAAHVVVPTGTGDQTPYLYNEKTTGTSILTVGDVKYTFSNKSLDHLTLVYIPDAMYQNEMVTKAEVAADKTATIKLDDGDRNMIEIKGGGTASDTVTVERRSSDKQKADVSLPANVTANIFGHEIGAIPAGGVKVSHAYAGNVKYPNRDYITIKNVGESITVDGVTYTADDADAKFYLGTFNVNITTGTDAEINGGKPADPHYLESYTVKISPKAGFDIDKNSFTVTMKKSDRAADGETTYSVAKNNFNEVCTEEADGSITVKLDGDRVVTGDITINAAAKRQMTNLKVTGLTDNGAKGTYTAQDQSGNTYKPNDQGEITVNRNEELTITFTPDDFTNPYFSDLTGEKGESFSILTGLTETTNIDNDLFDQTMKDSFDWTGKSYKLTYTPTQENVEFAATFTPSHIVHIHVTGGTAEVTDNTLLKKEAAGAQQFQHVIVADNGTVPVTLTDTTGHNPVVKTAYWSDVTTTPDDAGTNVTNSLTGAGPAYTYTTPAVTKPQALNVTFEEGQTVDVTVTHGTLDQAGRTWTDKGNNTYQTVVTTGTTLEVKVKPDTGYGLKSITVNGTPIDIEQAVKDNLLVYDADKGTYTHTSQNIYQAWKVEVDFEKQHEIIFKDQNGATINKTEHITVVDGGTIPKATFTKMQKETDKLKADNETFFVWVDENDNDKVYNEHTVIDVNTADQVTLTPVYRTNVTPPAADGSTIAADDFIIHVDDVRNLTADQAKTLANVKAYDADSNDITAQVTVDQTKLDDLKTKGKGTYNAALTFTVTGGAAVSVSVEVTDDNPAIIGKTAHTLTFVGRPDTTYNVQKMNGGNPEGNVLTFRTDADGKATAKGLDKATTYKISHKSYGSATGTTSLVDAADIADQFKDNGDTTQSNNATDETEKAWNDNVDVVVDDNGNYKVIVKKDIDHTVEIPDTWEDVTVDVGGNTITGDHATDADSARPGLDFIKDAGAAEHPGTNITVINGTIKGGDGSAEHPDGAPGVGTGEGAKAPENAQITVGTDGRIIGGNGADTAKNDPATDNGENGGNGGSGIEGNIKPTVDGGTVSGGDGGKGSDSATGKPGDGGNGGAGIKADKDVTVIEGTVNGGNAGNGGDATDDNTNPGGNGGEGGSGIDGGNNNIVIGPGNAEVNGGNGGNGGNSTEGNGGNGGNGGAGTETTKPGKTENNGGTINGGDGGNGGNTENGDGGNGGNGGNGSKGETDNNGGNINGGDGGNGGKSDNGSGGNGGNGGSATDKDPDNNNNGNENGGNGGNGGSGQPGGNGGNGGDGDNGNTGGNGNKGDETGGGDTESYKPVIIGKTAHTLTFTGKADTAYRVQEIADDGSLTGTIFKFKTDADGKATAVDLKKATKYRISHTKFGSVDGKTSLVDALDIAKQFEDEGANDSQSNNQTDKSEKADNSNVDVVVDDNGNYKVIVKKDIDRTIEIPDTWENVKIDLGGNTITGDRGTDTDDARPGLDFVKDPTINEHPGTNLEIINGTIKGGDGSEKHPDGAPGIGTKDAPENPANAGVEVGKDANIIGGNGADTKGTDADGSGTNGGNGGAGIDGEITPTINGGTVSGGDGGKGSDSSTGKPGAGGDGGAGITTDDKKVTVIEGTVNGGNAGNGGDATGGNRNEGGAGGNGGSGIDSGNGDIVIGPGKAEVNGGDGGNGGNSADGNGGNGGSGGNGTETEAPGKTDNNGGTINGGDGGNGGNSENGNGGDAGNGGTGSKGETDNKGDINGGDGGDGGNSNKGDGGNGGTGGNGTDGKTDNKGDINGGDGGNGGSSDNGSGGNGGNGGNATDGKPDNSNNGGTENGGNGGNGGKGQPSGNGGNGGTGENGNGNNGNSGDSGNNGNNGGNNGGDNNGNGGNNNGNGGNNGNGNGGNNGNGNGGNNSNGNGSNNTSTGITDDKAQTTDIAAADDSSASSRNNRNNRKNNKSDSADGEDVTDGTETDSDGTDSTEDTTDGANADTDADNSADGSGDADESIPADGSDVNGQLSFADCTFHWYPLILILVIAGYTGIRIKKIREELDEE